MLSKLGRFLKPFGNFAVARKARTHVIFIQENDYWRLGALKCGMAEIYFSNLLFQLRNSVLL